MLIKTRNSWELRERDATPEALYLNRRAILKTMGLAAGAGLVSVSLVSKKARAAVEPLKAAKRTDFAGGEMPTPFEDVTTYNNYYEFGTDKSDPSRNAHTLKPKPWAVKVEGFAAKTGTFAVEDLVDFNALEERIYRHRCVEAWSIVVPWVGVPMAGVLKKFEPTSRAKFVQFETLADPKQMPGLRNPVLEWPYVEGLRFDEAMHPLSMFTVGLYGKTLPNQNGAPLRVTVPWKYGFKSIKSIVAIRFVETQPKTSWNAYSAREYGFYSNVNPNVDHPRWSQAKERRIGEFFRRETLMFNGYAEAVADLYKGMDLQANF
jgi:methionine sulfoxide reductase catalytic subunit